MNFYPLKFRPIYKRRIWGGQKLRELFGKDIPPFERIGESWEVADLPEGESVVVNGELAGEKLGDVVRQYPEEVMGVDSFEGRFGLLIKFLDAEEVLSVQVHPDSEACKRLGKGEAKTECWYVISAVPGAVIYKGLKAGVTRAKFAQAIRKGEAADCLVEVEVEAGDCYFIRAGIPHSIGAGVFVAEIQTPSDTTYRVFDWNRVDSTGKGRELHVEEALESIDFGAAVKEQPVTRVGRLVDCEYFKIDKGRQITGCEMLLAGGIMRVLVVLSGGGQIIGKRGEEVGFSAGDCILVPAMYEGAMQFDVESEYLTVTI